MTHIVRPDLLALVGIDDIERGSILKRATIAKALLQRATGEWIGTSCPRAMISGPAIGATLQHSDKAVSLELRPSGLLKFYVEEPKVEGDRAHSATTHGVAAACAILQRWMHVLRNIDATCAPGGMERISTIQRTVAARVAAVLATHAPQAQVERIWVQPRSPYGSGSIRLDGDVAFLDRRLEAELLHVPATVAQLYASADSRYAFRMGPYEPQVPTTIPDLDATTILRIVADLGPAIDKPTCVDAKLRRRRK